MDSGRRPELESDQISVTTPLDVEIFGCEVDTFPKKVYTYWDFGSELFLGIILHAEIISLFLRDRAR